MKKQFITFEHKVSMLLRFGNLSASFNTGGYYFTPNEEALDVFGYTEQEKTDFAPFSGYSVKEVVDTAFMALTRHFVNEKAHF